MLCPNWRLLHSYHKDMRVVFLFSHFLLHLASTLDSYTWMFWNHLFCIAGSLAPFKMDYLYHAFLVLLTTQSRIQYKSHSYTEGRAIRGHLGWSVLPKDMSACELGEAGIGPPTFSLVGGRLYVLSQSMSKMSKANGVLSVDDAYFLWMKTSFDFFLWTWLQHVHRFRSTRHWKINIWCHLYLYP